jgi:hypothetical protein
MDRRASEGTPVRPEVAPAALGHGLDPVLVRHHLAGLAIFGRAFR